MRSADCLPERVCDSCLGASSKRRAAAAKGGAPIQPRVKPEILAGLPDPDSHPAKSWARSLALRLVPPGDPSSCSPARSPTARISSAPTYLARDRLEPKSANIGGLKFAKVGLTDANLAVAVAGPESCRLCWKPRRAPLGARRSAWRAPGQVTNQPAPLVSSLATLTALELAGRKRSAQPLTKLQADTCNLPLRPSRRAHQLSRGAITNQLRAAIATTSYLLRRDAQCCHFLQLTNKQQQRPTCMGWPAQADDFHWVEMYLRHARDD